MNKANPMKASLLASDEMLKAFSPHSCSRDSIDKSLINDVDFVSATFAIQAQKKHSKVPSIEDPSSPIHNQKERPSKKDEDHEFTLSSATDSQIQDNEALARIAYDASPHQGLIELETLLEGPEVVSARLSHRAKERELDRELAIPPLADSPSSKTTKSQKSLNLARKKTSLKVIVTTSVDPNGGDGGPMHKGENALKQELHRIKRLARMEIEERVAQTKKRCEV